MRVFIRRKILSVCILIGMSFISIYPGTAELNEDGFHVCDDKGIAITADAFKTMSFSSNVFERLCSSHFRTEILGATKQNVTICDTGLNVFKRGMLLMKSTVYPDALEVATRQEVTSHTLWQLPIDIDFEDKMVTTYEVKRVKVKRAVPVYEEVTDDPGSIVFDIEKGEYVVKTDKKEMKTVMEKFEVKDADGNIIKEELVPKMQVIEVEGEDPSGAMVQKLVPNVETTEVINGDGTSVSVRFKRNVEVVVLDPSKISACICSCECDIAKDKLTRLIPKIEGM